MEFSPDTEIRATIRTGSVYYFPSDQLTSPQPHYFVVVNRYPLQDAEILLLVATSKVEHCQMWYSACPPETLVILTSTEYPEFTVRTVVNCNKVFPITVEQLVGQRKGGTLQMKSEMTPEIVQRLRNGIKASPMVEGAFKLMVGV